MSATTTVAKYRALDKADCRGLMVVCGCLAVLYVYSCKTV